MFEKNVALSAPVRSAERQDFKADELRKGGQVFILQDESGTVGEVIQHVSIIDRTEDRVEIGVTNVTPGRIAFLTLFERDDSKMRLWIEREVEDRWTYYSFTGFLALPCWPVLPWDAHMLMARKRCFTI